MSSTHALSLMDVFRVDFRTSMAGDGLNQRLLAELSLDFRYQPARLALAASLAELKPPAPAPDLLGRPIRGETLFGQEEAEVAVWVGLLVEHTASLDEVAAPSRRLLVEGVAAHWARGADLIARRWSQWRGSPTAFIVSLQAI
ncbi:hypothetical protein [Brevundimonas sp.]|uniref:hypothetical protein n=1 Tax=Brevundimonas sp. TaxID=1871086 RepID=UPI003D6D966D